MKSLFRIALLIVGISIPAAGFTQDKKDTLKIDPDPKIKKTAKKVGNKTAEIAAKGAAEVVDQVYKGKVGPQGQTIYIDNESKYYYINKKGKKVYVSKSRLKDKVNP